MVRQEGGKGEMAHDRVFLIEWKAFFVGAVGASSAELLLMNWETRSWLEGALQRESMKVELTIG